MVDVAEPAEGAGERLEPVLALRGGVRRGARAGEPAPLGPLAVLAAAVERHQLGPPAAPVRVDARVARDLEDPGLEGDRGVGGAQPAQRGDEHLLRDVLGASVVVHHPGDEARDPAAVAVVEALEGRDRPPPGRPRRRRSSLRRPASAGRAGGSAAAAAGVCMLRWSSLRAGVTTGFPRDGDASRAAPDGTSLGATLTGDAPNGALLAHLDGIVHSSRFRDYGPNGLQVPGRDDDAPVRTVVTAVSANAETFQRAIAEGAELLLVHHGLLWGGPPRALDRIAAGAAAAPARRRARPGRLPPAARRPPGARQQRAAGPGDRRERVAPVRAPRGPPLGVAARSARADHRRTSSSPRVRERHRPRAAGLPRRAAGGAHRRHRVRRRRRPPRRRDGRGPRRLPHGRALRARHGAGAGGRHALPRRRATTRPRRSASGASATSSRPRFGVRHVFVDVPNPV